MVDYGALIDVANDIENAESLCAIVPSSDTEFTFAVPFGQATWTEGPPRVKPRNAGFLVQVQHENGRTANLDKDSSMHCQTVYMRTCHDMMRNPQQLSPSRDI